MEESFFIPTGVSMLNVAVIGSGYVGLVSGACFAHLGNRVICVDNQPEKVTLLNQGVMPIYEPGLDVMVKTNVAEGRLEFTSDIQYATRECDLIFICVGTPPNPDGSADLSAFESVVKAMAPALQPDQNPRYKVIVEKSTVPVRTGEWLRGLFEKYIPHNPNFDVASNPEFLREGSAIKDFLQTDRVVIGADADAATSLLVKLYGPLNAPILVTDLNSAELIKHASNAFLAMKISFINAVARVCEVTGADITKVAKGVGLDERIGEAFLQAGVGYGGACFPKDVQAFISIAADHGYDFKLLKAVEEINMDQRELLINKIVDALGDNMTGKKIGLLGLAFKPNTDDMRGAPSCDIIPKLVAKGATIVGYDPIAHETAKAVLGDQLIYAKTVDEAIQDVDAIVLLTEWSEFFALNLPEVKSKMKHANFIDGRNVFDPIKMARMGFNYYGIGRKMVAGNLINARTTVGI
jgi:UDPglucose 6-dehydrogenase